MTIEVIVTVAAGLISILAEYVPPFSTWYQELGPENKRAVMGLAMVVVVVGAAVLACFAPDALAALGVTVTCDQVGIVRLLANLFLALAANQGTHRITKRPGGGG